MQELREEQVDDGEREADLRHCDVTDEEGRVRLQEGGESRLRAAEEGGQSAEEGEQTSGAREEEGKHQAEEAQALG